MILNPEGKEEVEAVDGPLEERVLTVDPGAYRGTFDVGDKTFVEYGYFAGDSDLPSGRRPFRHLPVLK
jgi:hypothetical protein